MNRFPQSLLLQVTLAFLLIWAPTVVVATQGPSSIVPVLAATKVNNKSKSKASIESLKEKVLGIPPIELDLQFDVDVSFSGDDDPNSKTRRSKSKAKTRNAFVAKPRTPTAPPLPKKKKMVTSPPKKKKPKQAVSTKHIKKKKIQSTSSPKKSLSSHLIDLKRQLATVSNKISQHKYANIVWATLLFVWTPLLLLWLTNKIMGKEFLIGILVDGILPERVPASYIEMAIEDGLWVGIFGVCIVATAGAFVLEAATLVFDILSGSSISKSSKSTTKR